MRNITILLAALMMILVATNLPAGELRVRVPVNLNGVNNSSPLQNFSVYSYCPDKLGGWLFYKFGHHGFRSAAMSARQSDSYYEDLPNSAKRIKLGTITINAILDYDDYTHIDKFLENKE